MKFRIQWVCPHIKTSKESLVLIIYVSELHKQVSQQIMFSISLSLWQSTITYHHHIFIWLPKHVNTWIWLTISMVRIPVSANVTHWPTACELDIISCSPNLSTSQQCFEKIPAGPIHALPHIFIMTTIRDYTYNYSQKQWNHLTNSIGGDCQCTLKGTHRNDFKVD